MSFYADNEYDKDFPFDPEEVAGSVIDAASKHVKCPYGISVNLLITDNAGIREYNRDYRNIDKETDVLSFPSVDYDKPASFSIAESDKNSYFDPDTGELVLGDIIINGDRVFSQAEEYGHSPLREYAFLIAHSMLHLFGYDHIKEDDEKEMFAAQNAIMDYLKIER